MENTRQSPTHHHNDTSRPALRHRVRVAAAQMFAFGLDPERSTATEAAPFADLPPWEDLPDLIQDGPPCPNCGTDDTRWDAISPDYPGCWWTCSNGHRFLLDDDGRTWRER